MGVPTIIGAAATLAWRPFIDPINIFHDWWWVLLVPLALGVSVIYKAVRMRSLERYWRQVGIMTGQIVVAMIMLGAAAYVLFEVYVRFIADRAA